MMETEDKFLNAAKRALDEAEKNLDAGTVARLRAARREAIEQGLRRPSRDGASVEILFGLVERALRGVQKFVFEIGRASCRERV